MERAMNKRFIGRETCPELAQRGSDRAGEGEDEEHVKRFEGKPLAQDARLLERGEHFPLPLHEVADDDGRDEEKDTERERCKKIIEQRVDLREWTATLSSFFSATPHMLRHPLNIGQRFGNRP